MKQYQAMKEQDSTPPPTLGTKIIQHTLDLYPFSDFTNNDQGYILNMHIIDSSHQFGLLLAILKWRLITLLHKDVKWICAVYIWYVIKANNTKPKIKLITDHEYDNDLVMTLLKDVTEEQKEKVIFQLIMMKADTLQEKFDEVGKMIKYLQNKRNDLQNQIKQKIKNDDHE